MNAIELQPLVVWGVFTRLLGLVFLVSFGSLLGQVAPTAGRSGVMPVHRLLDKLRVDFPTWRRFFYFPTLLWLDDSDRMLRGLVLAGAVAAASVIYGGEHTPWALGLCYIVYLSLDRAIGLVFPWDCVLFEAGLLGVLLPATHALPDVTAAALPVPALAWAFRLLVFRVLFGFGKFKFTGSTQDDWGYLTGFLINQPLASPIGWYLHKAPLWMLKASMVLMFLVEIPIPIVALVPGWPGAVAGLAVAGLMLGIWATGNFGFFNLILIVLCTTLLDSTAVRGLHLAQLAEPTPAAFVSWFVLFHTAGAAMVFPLNSFCGQSWPHWPVFLRIRPRFLMAPVVLLRALAPFRWVHPYGVFPPKTMPGVKCIPVVEVTWDGTTWVECRHRFSPTEETSKPCFIAPHHPRGDQAVVYETFGLNDTSLMHNLVGTASPYGFTKFSGAHVLLQRVLEGRAASYGSVFFARGTFEGRAEPPVAARITTQMLVPTTHRERVGSGRWWTREYIGPHVPEMRSTPRIWREMHPEPELWHWEDVIWKRRSRLGLVQESARAGADSTTAALAAATDLTVDDVERFWGEFVPLVAALDRTTWEGLPDFVDDLRRRYDPDALRKLERILGRLSFALAEKLDPLFFDAGLSALTGKAKPLLDVKSYLHVGMLIHHIVCAGRSAFEKVWAEPRAAAELVPELTLARGLYLTAIFRFDVFVFEAQKLRLLQAIMEPKRAQFTLKNEKAAQALAAIAERTWGVVEVVPFLREHFRGPRFEQGHPERYPSFVLDPSGVVVRESAAG